jgi:hypothetical protein
MVAMRSAAAACRRQPTGLKVAQYLGAQVADAGTPGGTWGYGLGSNVGPAEVHPLPVPGAAKNPSGASLRGGDRAPRGPPDGTGQRTGRGG